jgi:cysteine-rich repeat protein
MRLSHRLGSFVGPAALLLACGSSAAGQHIYWSVNHNTIRRADLNGSNAQTIAIVDYINDLAIDPIQQKLYWTGCSSISRMNLDGSNVEELLVDSVCSEHLSIDLTAGRIYWTASSSIKRAGLDGSDPETVVVLGGPSRLALHPADDRLYWTDIEAGLILRAGLDGADIEPLVSDPLLGAGLALDLGAGLMYWTVDTGPDTSRLRRARLDGSHVLDLPHKMGDIADMALDLTAGNIYWVDLPHGPPGESFGSIRRANLDGSNLEILVEGLYAARALALWLDCDGNGMSNEQDVIQGAAPDCNGNLVPDECESQADCDGTGSADICDVADGSAPDCNNNQVPDGCEADTDCNVNGVQDFCDIANETSLDCNSNTVPDECDVDAGTSGDCDANHIPDECQVDQDCNRNGAQDICDIAAGAAQDCNANSSPDECEPDEDCNANGVQDICDIGAGTSPDCNANGIPDECPSNFPAVRVFLAPDGQQVHAAKFCSTVFNIEPGEVLKLMVWVQDTIGVQNLHAYQLILPWSATPAPTATGTVTYVDLLPGQGDGQSLLIDIDRPDWVFASTMAPMDPYYNETWLDLFGVLAILPTDVDVNLTDPDEVPNPGGIHYLFEFEVQASPTASGRFDLALQMTPPVTGLFVLFGNEFIVHAFQPLTLYVADCGDGQVEFAEECDDGNEVSGDGCDADCFVEACGNGIVQAGEDCDDAGVSAQCDADCTPPECGDGTFNLFAGEACDDGNLQDGDGCSAACLFDTPVQPPPEPVPAATPPAMAVLAALLLLGLLRLGRRRRR